MLSALMCALARLALRALRSLPERHANLDQVIKAVVALAAHKPTHQAKLARYTTDEVQQRVKRVLDAKKALSAIDHTA